MGGKFKCFRILMVVVAATISVVWIPAVYKGHSTRFQSYVPRLTVDSFASTNHGYERETVSETNARKEGVPSISLPLSNTAPKFNATKTKIPSDLLTLSNMKLPKFDESFRNPCWYDVYNKRTTLRCFPYFYIGGFAKSGTTDIFARLIAHPLIVPGSHKETYYFPVMYFEKKFWERKCSSNFHCGSVLYTENYFSVAAKRIAMTNNSKLMTSFIRQAGFPKSRNPTDTSFMTAFPKQSLEIWEQAQKVWTYPGIAVDATSTMVSDHQYILRIAENLEQNFPRNTSSDWIRNIYPGSKFILIMRHPSARAYSDHLMRKTRRKMVPSGKEFHQRMQQATDYMESCLQNDTSPLLCRHPDKFNGHLDTGLYYYHIKSLMERFPREQMFFLRFEDYSANITAALAKTFEFLDLPAISQEGLEFISKSGAKNAGNFHGEMLPETMALLNRFYKPYNEKLANLLGDDRYLWNDV